MNKFKSRNKPTLKQIRMAVKMGKVAKVYRLYQRFTGRYAEINPIKEGCTNVHLVRVCTNGLVLEFIGKEFRISMSLYIYPNREFVRPYVVTKTFKG